MDPNDKDTLSDCSSILMDGITSFHDGVQTSIGSQNVLCSWHIVSDRCWDMDHWHAEGWI